MTTDLMPVLVNLHSRGGKVAMMLAFNPSLPRTVLQNLIVADIVPVHASLSPEFIWYLKAMKKIESMKLQTRKEAWQVLRRSQSVGGDSFPDEPEVLCLCELLEGVYPRTDSPKIHPEIMDSAQPSEGKPTVMATYTAHQRMSLSGYYTGNLRCFAKRFACKVELKQVPHMSPDQRDMTLKN
ncbi:hypothetical protein EV359DRAFT_68224 [Lentinula novae-zelandiae]|nr:hypothetical protein EV359DRAFT_68224 [Lentinula novae-zelandiae]